VLEELEAILLVPRLAGTRGTVDEILRHKLLTDLEPVAVLELLNQTTNDGLVLFGHAARLPSLNPPKPTSVLSGHDAVLTAGRFSLRSHPT
jgi:hypothetical protein